MDKNDSDIPEVKAWVIPLKSAINSNLNPATCSSGNQATVPVQTLPTTASWTAPLIVA